MHQPIVVGLAAILALGISAQWFAWRLKIPSILLLLVFGFVAGPITGILEPDLLFGDLLFPFVSVSVAIILFEGGLSLKLDEVREVGRVVWLLISLGALVTWGVATMAAVYFLDFEFSMAVLLGAVVVVTGPTVVIPLLRQIRPTTQVSSVLKWEGILIDPVGATLAVLVFEWIVDSSHHADSAAISILGGTIITLLVGIGIGFVFGWLLIEFLSRKWIAGYLETAVTVMVVILAFAISNELVLESGLMAVTLMGIMLANQKKADIHHIVMFKEELGVLLLSVLFIVLAARVDLDAILLIVWQDIAFLAVLIFIARPITVFISSIGSNMPFKERLFMSSMAPRGIVAVSVASLFALELHEAGIANADQLVNITFTVVFGTVLFYSLTARPLARSLGLTQKQPEGTLIVGAHNWARQIASILQKAGVEVWLVDTNKRRIRDSAAMGLEAFEDSIMSDAIIDVLPMERIGRLLACTANTELNSIATLRFTEWLDNENVYQLVPASKGVPVPISEQLRGEILFNDDLTFNDIEKFYYHGAKFIYIKEDPVEKIKSNSTDQSYAHLLFLITSDGRLKVTKRDNPLALAQGESAIYLVDSILGQALSGEITAATPIDDI